MIQIKGLKPTWIVDLQGDFGLVSLCPQLSRLLLSLHFYQFVTPHLLAYVKLVLLLKTLDSLKKSMQQMEASLGKYVILCMNSGFSSVPEKMPKNANAARLAISHAVHSFISLYICTLIAPGGWAYMQNHYTSTFKHREKNISSASYFCSFGHKCLKSKEWEVKNVFLRNVKAVNYQVFSTLFSEILLESF